MNYLVIDAQYRIYQTNVFSGYLRAQAKAGKLSIVRLLDGKGMNRDGSWSEIQEWDSSFKVEAA